MMNKLISQRACFGTITRIEQEYGENKSHAEFLHSQMWTTLKNLENALSPYIKESSISKINESAGKSDCKIDYHTMELLKNSIHYSNLTYGAFDISIGPLVQLWGFGYIPSQKEIKNVLPLVNYKLINLNENQSTAGLLKEGQYIHPGGIAKGFACDFIERELKNSSILINMGGNILLINSEKLVGIQDPFGKPGDVTGVIKIKNKSVVTSGINERYFRRFFNTYHHLLDPRTGGQPDHNLASVTVICPSSTKADALATALFVLGIEKSKEIIRKENLDVIFINKKKEILCTAEIIDKFQTVHTFTKLPL